MRRARALSALAAVLRGEPDAPLPGEADGWSAFLELAAAHGLLPAAYAALRPTGRVDVPESLARALDASGPQGRVVPELVLRRAYDRNAERVVRLLDAGIELLDGFARDGMRAVPLKGLHSLLAGTWPDPAVRTMADLDVLVDAARGGEAYASLLASGFTEHPDPIGEHADHHLPMLRRDDVTVELHTELLVSRWSGLATAAGVLERAGSRPTPHGTMLLADDVDSFVHLVAHAQLQEETYTLLGLPLHALYETAQLDLTDEARAVARTRFERAGVGHVFDAHIDAAHRLFGRRPRHDPRRAARPCTPSSRRQASRHPCWRRAGRMRCDSRARSPRNGWPTSSAPGAVPRGCGGPGRGTRRTGWPCAYDHAGTKKGCRPGGRVRCWRARRWWSPASAPGSVAPPPGSRSVTAPTSCSVPARRSHSPRSPTGSIPPALVSPTWPPTSPTSSSARRWRSSRSTASAASTASSRWRPRRRWVDWARPTTTPGRRCSRPT